MHNPDYEKLFSFLDKIFPGLKTSACRCRKIGYAWEKSSTPFFTVLDGKVISHVGVMPIHLVIEGKSKIFGAIHAVATDPDYQGRGHAKKLMNEALDYCRKRYENILLSTSIPEFYKPFGFVTLPEHSFTLKRFERALEKPYETIALKVDDEEHVRLFIKLFKEAKLLSEVFCGTCYGDNAAFNTFFNSSTYPYFKDLRYCKDLDAIIAFELKDKTLKILDVVSSQCFSLKELLRCFKEEFSEVQFFFSPDQFCKDAISSPCCYDDSGIMVCDLSPFPDKPFMLQPLARC